MVDFLLKGILPGRYRLVAKAAPLCSANVPIRVEKNQKKKLIMLRPRGLDSCSYAETEQIKISTRRKAIAN
jgi:hypothetical protein